MGTSDERNKISFSLIGGEHQFLFALPVAAAISRRPDMLVTLFLSDAKVADAAKRWMARLNAGPFQTCIMELPALLCWTGKTGKLLVWRNELRESAAILAVERTSTLLKFLRGPCPPLVHIPHGSGDRAKGFERRISHFDYVIVAGEKDRDRMTREGIVAADRCAVSGHVKLSALSRLPAPDRNSALFSNGLPTILYNPHFNKRLSSWATYARLIIDAVKADVRYNLIVAPHVRLFAKKSEAIKKQWMALAEPGRIIVDLGSDRSSDGFYTQAADLYIGDVSSQVYEFIARPRPCLFINNHAAAWQNSPDYLMWRFGEVIDHPAQLRSALNEAWTRFESFRTSQQRMGEASFGDLRQDAAQKAADLLLAFIGRSAVAGS